MGCYVVVNEGRDVSMLSDSVAAAVILKTGVWQMQRKSRYAVIPAQARIQTLIYWKCLRLTAISNFRIPAFEGMAI